MISLHRSMHSSQMYTPGPAMSLLTCFWLLPQKLHFSRSALSMRATVELLLREDPGAGQAGEATRTREARFVVCPPRRYRSYPRQGVMRGDQIAEHPAVASNDNPTPRPAAGDPADFPRGLELSTDAGRRTRARRTGARCAPELGGRRSVDGERLGAGGQDLVDDPVVLRLFGGQDLVPVDVPVHVVELAAGVLGQQLLHHAAHPQD